MAPPTPSIHRITLFKIPSPADQTAVLEAFKTLSETATKDSAPYILAPHASLVLPDPLLPGMDRSQGFTVVAKTAFACREDMEFYDKSCGAHGAFKGVVGGVVEGGREGVVCLNWGG